MTILSLIKRIPHYASDVKVNVNSCFEHTKAHSMTQIQLYGVALTIGYILKNEELLNDIRSEAKLYLEDADARACKLASIMTAGAASFEFFKKAAQKANIKNIENHKNFTTLDGIQVHHVDFLMYSLAASIAFRCEAHTNQLIEELLAHKVSPETIGFIAKIVITLTSAYEALEIEALRSYDFIAREEGFS